MRLKRKRKRKLIYRNGIMDRFFYASRKGKKKKKKISLPFLPFPLSPFKRILGGDKLGKRREKVGERKNRIRDPPREFRSRRTWDLGFAGRWSTQPKPAAIVPRNYLEQWILATL